MSGVATALKLCRALEISTHGPPNPFCLEQVHKQVIRNFTTPTSAAPIRNSKIHTVQLAFSGKHSIPIDIVSYLALQIIYSIMRYHPRKPIVKHFLRSQPEEGIPCWTWTLFGCSSHASPLPGNWQHNKSRLSGKM